MWKPLAELFKVKSLMTIAIMVVFVFLSLNKTLDNAMVMSIISSVITYYFAKGSAKNE